MRHDVGVLLVAAVILLGACAPDEPSKDGYVFPPAPDVPDGPVDPDLEPYLRRLVPTFLRGSFDESALEELVASKDPRLAWFVSDLLRFAQTAEDQAVLVDAFERLTGVVLRDDPAFFETGAWNSVTDHLIAWDLPA
ncbi:MAG: hypothetical protein WD670_07530, partial [Actinomycetota bacterium]